MKDKDRKPTSQPPSTYADDTVYHIEAPCFIGTAVVRWRKGTNISKFATEMDEWVQELLELLTESIDPYAEDGAIYLSEYAKDLEKWVPKLPEGAALAHVTRAICVLRHIWEEIDRVDDTEINGLLQRISGACQSVLEPAEIAADSGN